MSQLADVVIVGGGINGAVLAYHLASLGAGRVVVIDEPRRASATAKSAAILASCYPHPGEADLARAGLLELERFLARTGRDIGFHRVGVVRLVSERNLVTAPSQVRRQQASGADVRLVPRDELAGLLPGGWFGDVAAAIAEADAGFADPLLALGAYQDAARELGVVFQRQLVHRVVTSSARVTGVETTMGELASSSVVVAAGAWSAGLLADLGITLGLSARRVQVAAFQPVPQQSAVPLTPAGGTVVLDTLQGLWLRPAGTGLLAGLELADAVPDLSCVAEHVEQWYVELCRAKLAARFPGLGALAMRGGWCGTISMSPDGLPIVDALSEYEGLFCIAGDSGSSFKAAPVIGLRLAERIVHGKPTASDIAMLARRRPEPLPGTAQTVKDRFAASVRLAREGRRARLGLPGAGVCPLT